jgi:hypothetical protein
MREIIGQPTTYSAESGMIIYHPVILAESACGRGKAAGTRSTHLDATGISQKWFHSDRFVFENCNAVRSDSHRMRCADYQSTQPIRE